MNKLSKTLLLVLCAALLVTASVMGTLAYLTSSTDPVINTFTMGNVGITLNEAKVTPYGVPDGDTRVMANTYKLIPGHTYMKDPTIHVNSLSEDCWVFMKLSNGLGNAAIINISDGWTKIAEADDGIIYAYNTILSANESSAPLFSQFQFAADAAPASFEGKTITLVGYAVQADGFDTAAKAWAASFGSDAT